MFSSNIKFENSSAAKNNVAKNKVATKSPVTIINTNLFEFCCQPLKKK